MRMTRPPPEAMKARAKERGVPYTRFIRALIGQAAG
jgi:predicted DNA binding CopG/RHH family protein